MVREDLEQQTQASKSHIYTVEILKQKFKTLREAKDNFKQYFCTIIPNEVREIYTYCRSFSNSSCVNGFLPARSSFTQLWRSSL